MIEELMKKIASMEKAISRMQLEIDALNENTAEKYNKIEDCPQWSKNTIKLLQNKPSRFDPQSACLVGDNGDLKLTYEDLRILTILDRADAFNA